MESYLVHGLLSSHSKTPDAKLFPALIPWAWKWEACQGVFGLFYQMTRLPHSQNKAFSWLFQHPKCSLQEKNHKTEHEGIFGC